MIHRDRGLIILTWIVLCGWSANIRAEGTYVVFEPDHILPEAKDADPLDKDWQLSPNDTAPTGAQQQGDAVHLENWAFGSRLQSPPGLIPVRAIEPGGKLTIDLKLRVDRGRLYLRIHNGVRFFQVTFASDSIAFSKINPNEAVTYDTMLSKTPHLVRIQFRGRQVAIEADGRRLGQFDAGLGGASAFSGLEWLSNDQQQPPDAWLYQIGVRIAQTDFQAATQASGSAAELLEVQNAWPAREYDRDGVKVTVGPLRVIMRQARSALVVADDDLILLTGGHTIASEDQGETWRPRDTMIDQLNSVFLSDGRLLMMRFDPKPVADQPGLYRTDRWISDDRGHTFEAVEPAELRLPVDIFDPARLQWFHSGLIRTPNGDLLSVMQGEEVVDSPDAVLPWRLFLVRSKDEGRTWQYVSMLTDHERIEPIRERLTANGWRIYGGVEPSLVALNDQTLICIARTVDDESALDESLFAEGSQTYHDLSYTVRGDAIHSSIARLPADLYYKPGVPSAPAILMRSDNGGKTWSAPRVMEDVRGCFPRLAQHDGVIAVTFGGLSVPRWGSAICFSFDRGNTWTEPVVFAPFLTTGYTAVVATENNRFTVFFDCTPPQSWMNAEAFWIGAVDITLERDSVQ